MNQLIKLEQLNFSLINADMNLKVRGEFWCLLPQILNISDEAYFTISFNIRIFFNKSRPKPSKYQRRPQARPKIRYLQKKFYQSNVSPKQLCIQQIVSVRMAKKSSELRTYNLYAILKAHYFDMCVQNKQWFQNNFNTKFFNSRCVNYGLD